MRLLRVCMTAIAITGLVAGSAAAQDDGPNNGAVSLGAGIDFSTSYFFRGIIQETEGFIAQPFLEGGISLYESGRGRSPERVGDSRHVEQFALQRRRGVRWRSEHLV